MKIRTKILCGFMITVLVSVIIGITGLVSSLKLTGISTDLLYLQAENGSISKILNAHYVWRQTLTESVLYGREFTGSLDAHTCALGKWYDSEEAQNLEDPEAISLLRKLDVPHAFIHNEAKTTVALLQGGNLEEARTHFEDIISPKTAEVIAILTELQERYIDLSEKKELEVFNIESFMRIVNIVMILIGLIVSVCLALFISNMISKPIEPLTAFFNKAASTGDISVSEAEMAAIGKFSHLKDELGQLTNSSSAFIGRVTDISKRIETIANGDLTLQVELLSNSDVIGKSIKNMVDGFNNMFTDIYSVTDQVSTGSKQVAEAATDLAQGATDQAASVEQLSAAISDVAKKTEENADLAEKAAELAGKIHQNAEGGNRQMAEMMEAVREIDQASQSISKVIKVIDDIAFQTNILALNAAVEAARAGEHGKGFAVVAEEVRNLAAKSAVAAKDTEELIANSIEKTKLGARIAEETAASLVEIVSGINESHAIVNEIASSSRDQSFSIEQINTGIDQVTEVVQQNSATAEESAAASEEMSGQAHILQELISQFTIKKRS